MIPLAQLAVLFFIILGLCHGMMVGGYSTEYPCYKHESPLVVLQKDPITGNFSVVYRMQQGEPLSLPGVQVRHLEANHDDNHVPFLRHQVSPFPAIMATGDYEGSGQLLRSLQAGHDFANVSGEDNSDSGLLFYAWECGCFGAVLPTVYCPMDIETCLQPFGYSPTQLPGCHNLPKAYDFRRYSFLITVVWFFAILTALVTSRHGPFLFGFFIAKCFPSWNDRAVDRLLQGHPDQVRDMIRIYIIREQRALFEARLQQDVAEAGARQANEDNATGEREEDGDDESPSQERDHSRSDNNNHHEPKSPRATLVLRTKNYTKAPPRIIEAVNVEQSNVDSSISDIEEEDQCTICFLSFQEGDRIGSLRCKHLFHSECLKRWVQRRNACPLCQEHDIAQLRVESNVSDTEAAASPIDNPVDPTTNSRIGSNA